MEKERLYKYFSGEASVDEENEIMNWAEISPENYKKYLKERELWNAMLVNMPFSAEETWIKKGAKKSRIWMITAVASSAALILTLFYFTQFVEKQVEGDSWQTIYVPPGQRAQVVLNDSTVVWLNSKSTLKYPSSFNSDIREVQLNGEGYFEVVENEKKPFIVKTSRYDIAVLGTNFNVFAYDSESFFEVSLIDGIVRVLPDDKNNPEIILRQNEKATEVDGKLIAGIVENFDHFRWREGLICIDGEPLEIMMEKFSLYFDIKIIIENPALLKYSPTGKFRHSDGIEHALKVLQKDVKFTYIRDYESNEIFIK